MSDEILTRITDEKFLCRNCGWIGKLIDCEPDVDNDGSPGCPNCLTICEWIGAH